MGRGVYVEKLYSMLLQYILPSVTAVYCSMLAAWCAHVLMCSESCEVPDVCCAICWYMCT